MIRSTGFKVLVLVLLFFAFRQWDQRPIHHPPGVLVADTPRQSAVGNQVFRHRDYILTRRAQFELDARVLSSERYYLDAGASLAPVDLALGWGPMSDESVLEKLDVSQSGRWYHLRWDLPPLPVEELMKSSGNMHMIPAEDWVEKKLKSVRAGQLVRLQGYLVDATGDNGWQWNTSLSRTDTGGGSCELFYVESVSLLN